MTPVWNPHRFTGGALALDVANSVVLRFVPGKRQDRFDDRTMIRDFADAARCHCAERSLFSGLVSVPDNRIDPFLKLREAIDAYFRVRADGHSSPLALADLLEKIAATLRLGEQDDGLALDTATAQSALRLLAPSTEDRVKICAQCHWLFLDRSKNRSRTWCDMAVCGNRVKARLHYRRTKQMDAP
jgi:predicted RNA-binding Zn ribbon-like protein